jgi:lipid-binding SYLF domain-containing protein
MTVHPPPIAPWLRGVILIACVVAPAAAGGQSLLDGLKQKASDAAAKVGETAGAAADAAGELTQKAVDTARKTVDDTRSDLRDEDTPAATRAKLDAMADATLSQLFEERPEVRPLFDASVGYAVFDTRQAEYVVAAGYGRGVAVDLETGQRTYMKMGSAGVGISFGFGGFDSRVVILFENAFGFHKFVTQGLDAAAEAGTMTGDETDDLTLRYEQGRAVFVLTNKGWKVSAKLAGTKYWPDKALN